MRRVAIWTAKTTAIWAVALAAAMLGNRLFPLPMEAAPDDGPLTSGQAFLVVNGLTAIVLSVVAANLTGPTWRRAGLLFALLFLLETLLSQIEAWFFAQWLDFPAGMMRAMLGAGAVKALATAGAAALLWMPREMTGAAPSGLAWKLPATAGAYILLYFGAGYFVAWQSASVRAYYGEGLEIDTGRLALLQAARGVIWAGLALAAAWALAGPVPKRACLAGTAFAVLMAAPLLFPNPFMPWDVRSAHLLEIGLSNFLFGLLAVPLLCTGDIDRKIRKGTEAAAA